MDGPARDEVAALGAVARRPHPGRRRGLPFVDVDGALHPELEAGVGGQRRVRRDADAQHDEVGADRPVVGEHRLRLEAGDRHPAAQVEAVVDHRRGHQRTHLRIERPHGLRGLLDDDRRAPPLDEGLGHLQADVAAADDHHALAAIGQALRVVEQVGGVVQVLHAVDEGQVDAGQVRADGRAPGGDEQLVEAEAVPVAVERAHLDLPGGQVDGRRLVPRAHVRPLLPVLLGRAGHEPFDAAVDHPAHEVGDPAGRVAGPRAPLQGDDLRVGTALADPRHRGHAGRVAADDHHPLAGHGSRCGDEPDGCRCRRSGSGRRCW